MTGALQPLVAGRCFSKTAAGVGVGLLALAAAVVGPGAIGTASAHPFALSFFDAVTEGRDIKVSFKLDATCVADMLSRESGGENSVPIADIAQHKDVVFDYLADRFRLVNGDLPCRIHLPDTLVVHPTTSKVLLDARYRCPTDLGFLVIRSTLFDDEGEPHDIVGNFRHQRAFERYFFSKTSSEARINVPELRQVLPSTVDPNAPFRTATPPPGAFAERAANPVVGVPVSPRGLPGSGTASPPARGWRGFGFFIQQGVVHILGGLDHLLFVVTLIIAIRRVRELLIIITSFTIAHSITLVLGTLGLVYMSPRLAEPLIALSIIYVAVENVLRQELPARARVTFAFGLIHGFGFSSVLRDLGFASADAAPMVVGFNLGVELGQLLIVLPLFPLVFWLRNHRYTFTRVALGTNVTVALVACWWFVERLRG